MHFQNLSVPTPVAEVRRDNEKVGRVGQVLAEQLPIFLLLRLTQGTHEHRDDAKLVFVAGTSNDSIYLSAITAPHCHNSAKWEWMKIKSALIHLYAHPSVKTNGKPPAYCMIS